MIMVLNCAKFKNGNIETTNIFVDAVEWEREGITGWSIQNINGKILYFTGVARERISVLTNLEINDNIIILRFEDYIGSLLSLKFEKGL